jgi:hypothetical protein
MSQVAHIFAGVALVMGCATGILSAGHLVYGWRMPGSPGGAGSRDRALASVFLASWMLLSFGPWLAGWNSTIVLVMTWISLVPVIVAVRFLMRSSATRRHRSKGA